MLVNAFITLTDDVASDISFFIKNGTASIHSVDIELSCHGYPSHLNSQLIDIILI